VPGLPVGQGDEVAKGSCRGQESQLKALPLDPLGSPKGVQGQSPGRESGRTVGENSLNSRQLMPVTKLSIL